MKNLIVSALIAASASAFGQTPTAFPSDAPIPKAAEIHDFVKDKTFTSTRSDGVTGKFNYRSDGKFDVIYTSFKEFGAWKADDGNICVDDPINGKACNQVRITGNELLYRRNKNGEILTLKPS
ncbi:hypothetical protein FFI97_019480 [Variovorax sp. KBS0712]|uniref:hypothetical protein n=1 Tax=Variovorax sp. KBS0712 TaxID=2578111 RepID=UPI001118C889|nr:hypothetical protein [Variovorax sp. KBS0712]TSD56416.1 hypothetical protein FFI97_019480 [Variovorax sp. KBS0712]